MRKRKDLIIQEILSRHAPKHFEELDSSRSEVFQALLVASGVPWFFSQKHVMDLEQQLEMFQ